MVVFLRTIHASVDSRLARYVLALEQVRRNSLILHWARGGSGDLQAKSVRFLNFSKNAALGGGWRNAVALVIWMSWCFIMLFKERKTFQIIHAVDLDTVLPALLFSKIFRKKLIFDIYDSYGDARSMTGLGRLVADKLERFAAVHADHVIIPDACRLAQVPSEVKNIRIIENVPFDSLAQTRGVRASQFDGVTLAYVGILEAHHRGLEDLLSVVARFPDTVRLEIAGFGPLSEACAKAMQMHKNIRFHGAVTPERAVGLMSECDIIVGMYYRTKEHHIRATPNKYYEHLMLSKPLLTTQGTPPGEKVETGSSGWAITEGAASIERLLSNVTKEECGRLASNAGRTWEHEYVNYFSTVLVEEYASELCSI